MFCVYSTEGPYFFAGKQRKSKRTRQSSIAEQNADPFLASVSATEGHLRHILAFAERSLCSAAVPRHTGSELGRSVNRELVGHTGIKAALNLLSVTLDAT
jgi:hypothetical protein